MQRILKTSVLTVLTLQLLVMDAVAQDQIPTYTTKTRRFEIPYTVTSMDASAVTTLWVSVDRGKAWSAFAKETGQGGSFQFQTKQDGEYWFRSQTGAEQVSSGSTPQLRVYVDATPPRIQMTARNLPEGDVLIESLVTDQTVVANQVLMQITTGPNSPWEVLPFQGKPIRLENGDVRAVSRYKPTTASRVVVVRTIARDGAGNTTGLTKQVFVTPSPEP